MGQKGRHRAGRIIIRLFMPILAISITFLYLLCLTGSAYTDSRLPPFYLVEIQKSNTSIFVGFYGICTSSNSSSSSSRICSPTILQSAESLEITLFPNATTVTSNATANAGANSFNTATNTTAHSSAFALTSPPTLNTSTSTSTSTSASFLSALLSPSLTLQRNILPTPLPLATLLHLLPLLLFEPLSFLLLHARSPFHSAFSSRRRHVFKTLHLLSLAMYSVSGVLALAAAAMAVQGVGAVVFAARGFSGGGNGDGGGGDGDGDVIVLSGKWLMTLMCLVAGLQVLFAALIALWGWGWGWRGRGHAGSEGKNSKRVDFTGGWWREEEEYEEAGKKDHGPKQIFIF